MNDIFEPVFVMLALTVIVWIYMYAKRIPFIMQQQLTDEQMTPLGFMQLTPPDVANPSDNLKNLFEVPVLFYFLCLYLYTTQQVDAFYLTCAWLFTFFRILHSVMHCTRNIVIVRFWLNLISCLAFFTMLGRATFAALG